MHEYENPSDTLIYFYQFNVTVSSDFRVTNKDGRAGYFVPQEAFTQGTYKMFFDTGAYFKQLEVKGFYPYVEVSGT